jgi:hypothetical protein
MSTRNRRVKRIAPKKVEESAKFPPLKKERSTLHLHHTIHHPLSTKTPSPEATFPKTTLKKTPAKQQNPGAQKHTPGPEKIYKLLSTEKHSA